MPSQASKARRGFGVADVQQRAMWDFGLRDRQDGSIEGYTTLAGLEHPHGCLISKETFFGETPQHALGSSRETLSSLSAVPRCAGSRYVSGSTGTADKRALNSTAAYGD